MRSWPPPGLATTRRGFLQLAGTTAALGALAQLRAWPAAAAAAPAGARFFDAAETEILTRILERVCDTGHPAAPAPGGAVGAVDALCASLDPALSAPLPLALRLFEYGPLLFDLTFTRFTRMTPAQRDASLRAWMTSRLELRRLAFAGVRNLCLLGYYSQPETWPLIGYAGPLLPARGGAA
jgi:hypothetical protein